LRFESYQQQQKVTRKQTYEMLTFNRDF